MLPRVLHFSAFILDLLGKTLIKTYMCITHFIHTSPFQWQHLIILQRTMQLDLVILERREQFHMQFPVIVLMPTIKQLQLGKWPSY